MEQARRLGVLGQTAGLYGTALGKPKEPGWFDRLLSGASSAAGAYAASGSDSRLKDNVEMMADKLSQLNGVTFRWNENAAVLGYPVGQMTGGVMADDVEKVFPELVRTINGYKHVDYMALTGLLVETVKDLHRRLNG
jgi:hypothetical protein